MDIHRRERNINYIIGNQKAVEEIENLKIEERIDSDHLPVEVTLCRIRKEENEMEEEKEIERRKWKEETKEEYLRNCEEWNSKGEGIEEIWKEIKEKIEEVIPKKKKRRHK